MTEATKQQQQIYLERNTFHCQECGPSQKARGPRSSCFIPPLEILLPYSYGKQSGSGLSSAIDSRLSRGINPACQWVRISGCLTPSAGKLLVWVGMDWNPCIAIILIWNCCMFRFLNGFLSFWCSNCSPSSKDIFRYPGPVTTYFRNWKGEEKHIGNVMVMCFYFSGLRFSSSSFSPFLTISQEWLGPTGGRSGQASFLYFFA